MIQIVSQRYGIEGVGVSMKGGRPENQDDIGYIETPAGFLLVVCDGMGGGPGGKLASHIVKTAFMDAVAGCPEQTDAELALKRAVEKANDALEEVVAQQPGLAGMGSTIVALLIAEKQAYVAHDGDSRCYRIKAGKVVFCTENHSLVWELYKKKALSEEQARTSSQANVITRAIGSRSDNHVADIDRMPYRQGDRFVLCSDGVWGIMPHEDLKLRLTSEMDVDTLVKSLSAEVDKIGFAAGGHHDNHTLAMIEMKKDSLIKDKMSNTIKMLLGAMGLLLLASFVFNLYMLRKEMKSSRDVALVQEQLEEACNENAALSSKIESLEYDKQALSQSLQESSDNNLKRIEVMMTEKATLKRENDSLAGVNAQLQKKLDVLATEKQRSKAVKAAPSALEMAEALQGLFENYSKVSGRSVEAVQNRQDDIMKQIKENLNQLRTMDNQKYRAEADAIKHRIEDKKWKGLFDHTTKVSPSKTRGLYVTNGNTVNHIKKEIMPKIERIKEKAKK